MVQNKIIIDAGDCLCRNLQDLRSKFLMMIVKCNIWKIGQEIVRRNMWEISQVV